MVKTVSFMSFFKLWCMLQENVPDPLVIQWFAEFCFQGIQDETLVYVGNFDVISNQCFKFDRG